jgi:hypothetical protein
MSEVKIVLKRSPRDSENGVWVDGVKLPDVMDVTVYGTATDIPHVVLTLVPKKIVIGVENPDIDKVPDGERN